jgi:hypothetical protein
MIRGIWEVGKLLLSSSLQPDPTLNDPGSKYLVSNSKPGDSQNAPLQVNLTLIPPSESFTFFTLILKLLSGTHESGCWEKEKIGRNIKGKVLPKGFSGVKETRPHEEDKGWCLYNLVFQLWVGQFLEKKVRDTLQQF